MEHQVAISEPFGYCKSEPFGYCKSEPCGYCKSEPFGYCKSLLAIDATRQSEAATKDRIHEGGPLRAIVPSHVTEIAAAAFRDCHHPEDQIKLFLMF